ncbi:YceI family protein [Desulfobacter vibrioformis]|uniref:YceI family protein n=1 Tax=Desulfobacter vibrioformis TaxID=34031 RepID=UPI00054CF887|nr:YceI family protein [Desulfobacter vibrioformis]
MKPRQLLIAVLILLFSSTAALAQTWEADKDHTEIRFEINHILTTVSGYFRDYDADISFDPKHPEDAKFNFTVKVKSIDTHIEKRDAHLGTGEFFDSDTYPEMTFVSKKISKIAKGRYALEGVLTIKDVSKNIKTQFQYFGPKPHPFAKEKMVSGFTTEFSLNRLDYHVGNGKYVKMGIVGENVHITITIEALADKQ